MTHTFMKKGFKGFTLIELLVVIAIIGLLSTIIAAPIQNARKKARDAKKIAELKGMQLALEQYAESNNGEYPLSLYAISPTYMPVLPTFSSSSLSSRRDAYAYVWYIGHSTGAEPMKFSYHLGSKLEVYGPALETDRDCIGASAGTQLQAGRCVVFNTNDGQGIQSFFFTNGTQIGATSTAATNIGMVASATIAAPLNALVTNGDFHQEAETPTDTCVGTMNCIFDVTGQQ